MTVRRLENEDEEKFWEAWIKDDLIFCYRYGKLGASGHTKLKKFKTRAEAEAELEAKLQEKLDEGFSEPGAEEAEAEEAEEEAEEAEEEAEEAEEEAEKADDDEDEEAEEAPEAAADDSDDSDDEDSDDEDEDSEDEDSDDEEPEETAASEEDSDEDEDSDDEDEDSDDEDERPRRSAKPSNVVPVAVEAPPPPPEPPRLPRRFEDRDTSPEAIDRALKALDALSKAAGKRSWHVSRRGRTARRALERLGGVDPDKSPLAASFDPVMSLVLAPKKRLPLEIALGLLWEIDATAYKRIIGKWRAKMLSSPASTSIAVLAATFDAVDDPEVAVHAGAALVDRRLPNEAWKRRFSKVRPFFEEALGKKGSSVDAFLGKLKADADPVVRARVAAAAEVDVETKAGA